MALNKCSSEVRYNKQYRPDKLSATSYISVPEKQKSAKCIFIIF